MHSHQTRGKVHRVVIAGGGFGGVVAARHLANHPNIHVTLITDNYEFRYNPALYRVATGYWRKEAIMPLSDLIDTGKVELVIATVEHVDHQKRTVSASNNRTYGYEYAIFALGVVTSYFGIAGLENFSYGIKTIPDLKRLHDHLHQQLTATHRPDTNYLVVGGGPTGVELSASLVTYLKFLARQHHLKYSHISVELIEAAPRLLPTMHPTISKITAKRLRKLGVKVMVNSKVESETAKSLTIGGRSIPTHTVIWTAGVTNNPFYKAEGDRDFKLNERGKVIVDTYLRANNYTYVVGDNAATTDSGLAQIAVRHGKFAARDIIRRLDGRHRTPYKTIKPAYVVPVGHNWAVMQWRSFRSYGWVVGQIRKAADLIGYADVMGWKKTIALWRHSDNMEDCDNCAAEKA